MTNVKLMPPAIDLRGESGSPQSAILITLSVSALNDYGLYKVVKDLLNHCIRETDIIISLDQGAWIVLLENSYQDLGEYYAAQIRYRLHQLNKHLNFRGVNLVFSIDYLKTLEDKDGFIYEYIATIRKNLNQIDLIQKNSLKTEENSSSFDQTDFILRAICEERICLAFQPIVEAQSYKIKYYECLSRILEEDGNPVSVGGFIGGCEQSGLIQALDIKSLELALKELTLCPDLYLSLNVSPLTFLTPFWLDMLRNSLSSMPDVAKRLMIEVTENSIMFDLDKIVEFFSIIQSLGSKVAIDDFGAGYIPMGILKDHIVDVIKIDKQYTQHVENNKNNLNMIRALQSLLTPHGIKVVAEGVETLSCIEILKQESIDALQGYYFGKPSIIRPWIP